MIETQSLVDDIERLATLPWCFAFIGLNDLMITRTANSLWIPFIDGTVDHIYKVLSGRQIGYGGVSLIDKGHPLPFKMLLKEMARHGIRVAAIAPGYINTEMTSAIREDVKQKIIDQIPLKRMGEPNEISHSVFYILENDYFTGRVIECDGGFRI